MSFISGLFGGGDKSSSSTTNAPTTNTSMADNRVVLGNGATQVGAGGSFSSNSGNSTSTLFSVFDASQRNTSYTDSRDFSDRSTTSNSTSLGVWDSSQRNTTTSYLDTRDQSTSVWDSSQRNTSTSYLDTRDQSTSVWDSSQRNTSTAYTDARVSDTGHNVTNIAYSDPGAVQLGQYNAALLQAVAESQGDTVKAIAKMGTDSIGSSAAAATDLFATGSAASSAAWGHTIDTATELIDRLMTQAGNTLTGAQSIASQAIDSYQPSENKSSDTQMRIAMIGAAAVLLAAFLTRK